MSEVTAEMIERGRGLDPEVAAHRRRIAAHVKETRERLTSSGTGHRASDLELLTLFAQSRMTSLPALMLLSLAVAGMSSIWVPLPDLLIWLVLAGTSQLVAYQTAKKLLALTEADVLVRFWRRRFVITELLHSTVWALLPLLYVHATDPNARTLVLFVLMLIAALTSLFAATVPLAVYAGLVPTTIAIVVFLRPLADAHSWPLPLMAGGAQIFFVVLEQRLYSTTLSSLSFRLEKDMLIAELEQAKSNSDEARRRAEEANLAKSRFLATMSHELRTPLNAILGFSEVMKGELFGQHIVPAYKEYSNDIHSSGQHLLMLINEILDLSRVEAGRYELREEPVAVAHVVEDCLHLLSLRAKKRDITIKEAIEPALPRIWGDERAVRQVTLNLLTNAIKFTPQGGTVTVKCGWTQNGGQYISIRDTGPGIPEHEIPIVMSSFGRGSLAQKNADEGSGLGLPIVKGLVELHGGTFTIKSEVRVGTEVIVVFPAERVINALPPMAPDKPKGSERPYRRRDAA
ncbi:MAG: two-component sensor histidine kinase [Hyphomicrobiales bacterium]|nr:two-component sensor histidine kinase [Hyphomicrobiales bacterium]